MRAWRTFVVGIGLFIGSTGCSLGLDLQECSADNQCFSGQMCIEGTCQSVGDTDADACVPFEVAPCVCDDGALGTKTCREDATYTACVCDTESTTGDPAPESTTSGPGPGGTTPDDTAGDASSTTDDPPPSSDSSSSESSSGAEACVVVTPDALIFEDGTSQVAGARFYTNLGDLGLGEAIEDEFRIEFWFGNGAGEHDLGTPDNLQYATCTECVRLYEDTGARSLGSQYYGPSQFLQSEGLLSVETDPTLGEISLTLTGVRLVEVTFDPGTTTSVPVDGGRCIDIVDGTFATPPAPSGWTCASTAYADLLCDCGCGELDQACGAGGLGVCESCNAPGSCDLTNSDCPGVIDPADLTQCDTETAPEGWTCPEGAFSDGTCDCGCGVFDAYDCADLLVASCNDCGEAGACSAGMGCDAVLDDNNAFCR